ncbi:MAG: helix-turn-helix transcriptional regulator [Gammaproteobacteria bacterium]|nr:helix-turn-helix transcriptional regulator [Gammaproteobacteria bacterium]
MKQNSFRYPIDKAIGQAIKELRKQAGYRMRELAEIGNVPHSFFGKIENYERRLTFGELEEVASWIGVEVNDIITKAKQIEQQGSHVQIH